MLSGSMFLVILETSTVPFFGVESAILDSVSIRRKQRLKASNGILPVELKPATAFFRRIFGSPRHSAEFSTTNHPRRENLRKAVVPDDDPDYNPLIVKRATRRNPPRAKANRPESPLIERAAPAPAARESDAVDFLDEMLASLDNFVSYATILCFGVSLGGNATAFIATLGPIIGLCTMIITRFSSGYFGGTITRSSSLPAELLLKYTTIKYTLSRPAQAPPVFFFVVDTCLDAEDLKALRNALVISLSLVPPYALVGLITFGTMVHTTITRAAPHAGQPMPQQAFGAARFLLPVQQCELQLVGILEALPRDPWPIAND
ncbi:hypothetical protein EDD22DRAFT_1029186 [Suillus occidentalis]|nr:hypothetical protein EDD22DRAFT_1029186 [Suillus occidentalis]